jgi:hypothetical protein
MRARRFVAAAFFAAALPAALRVANPAVVLLTTALVARPALAHLMEDQKGTLKFVGAGAFLVISLPVSGFTGVDDDADARLSSAELRAHWKSIEDQVKASVRLSDGNGPRPLEGIILDISPPHERPDEPATHLVALGRFALADEAGPHSLRIERWGKSEGQRSFEIGVTRGGTKRFVSFEPERPEAPL